MPGSITELKDEFFTCLLRQMEIIELAGGDISEWISASLPGELCGVVTGGSWGCTADVAVLTREGSFNVNSNLLKRKVLA